MAGLVRPNTAPILRNSIKTADKSVELYGKAENVWKGSASFNATLTELGASLFEDRGRNMTVFCQWIRHPIVVSASKKEVEEENAGWEELERERQKKRMMARRGDSFKEHQSKNVEKVLVTAATSGAGKRLLRVSSVTTLPLGMNSSGANLKPTSPQCIGTRRSMVDDVSTVMQILLLEPFKLTVACSTDSMVTLHLFGSWGDKRQISISSEVMTPTELATIHTMATSLPMWCDVGASSFMSQSGETLVGNLAANIAFDEGIDRIQLIRAFCEALLSSAGPRIRCSQMLQASVMALSAHPAVMNAGYHVDLVNLVNVIRATPTPRIMPTPEQLEKIAEYVVRNNFQFISLTEYYFRMMAGEPPTAE